jgi:ubiquinone/menaquinone biosynthesis C-methylase UbiE
MSLTGKPAPMAPRVHHPVFARVYDRISRGADAKGASEHRAELLAGLGGRVIEVGAGNGLNFAHYPPSVTELVATEPENFLRARAEQAARAAPFPIRVVDAVAEELPGHDWEFDAGVASLVLCTVTDIAAALAELHRVIRPGGELRFYEHVVSERPGLARVQRLLERTIWPLLAGGCHPARDTLAAIEAAGFVVERCRRFNFRPFAGDIPTEPRILGRARRPSSGGAEGQ